MSATARPSIDAAPLPAALAALRGAMVTRFIVDDSLTIVLHAAGREATLRIDGEGVLIRAGAEQRFSPDAEPAGLAPVLSLLHARVLAIALEPDGRLELAFDGGDRLAALPDHHGVSWSVRSCEGASAIGAACIAEGRVVWE